MTHLRPSGYYYSHFIIFIYSSLNQSSNHSILSTFTLCHRRPLLLSHQSASSLNSRSRKLQLSFLDHTTFLILFNIIHQTRTRISHIIIKLRQCLRLQLPRMAPASSSKEPIKSISNSVANGMHSPLYTQTTRKENKRE